MKICAYCGKSESQQWARHNKRHHANMEPKQWMSGQPLLGDSWCENWLSVILDKAIPQDVRHWFKNSKISTLKPGQRKSHPSTS